MLNCLTNSFVRDVSQDVPPLLQESTSSTSAEALAPMSCGDLWTSHGLCHLHVKCKDRGHGMLRTMGPSSWLDLH